MSARLERAERAARRAAARHEPRQRPLPDRLRQLERRAARRARRHGDALHRLPLHRGGASGRRSRGAAGEALADAGPRRAAEGAASSSRPTCCRTLEWERAAGRRARSSCRRAGRRGAAGGQGRGRDREAQPRRRRSPTAAFEALTAETWIGRSERELAWRLRQLLHAHGADELSFDSIVASGANGAQAARAARPTRSSSADARHGRLGRAGRRLLLRLHAHVRDRRLPERLREVYDVCLEAQQRGVRGHQAGLTGVEADALARDLIEAAASARTSATASATASASRSTRRRGSRPSRPTRSSRAWSRSSRASTSRASAASGSRTSRSSATTASSC